MDGGSISFWKSVIRLPSFTHSFTGSSVSQESRVKVKSLPAMRETWVQSLGGEDPLEKEVANHSRTHVWKIPWTEKPSRL